MRAAPLPGQAVPGTSGAKSNASTGLTKQLAKAAAANASVAAGLTKAAATTPRTPRTGTGAPGTVNAAYQGGTDRDLAMLRKLDAARSSNNKPSDKMHKASMEIS